MDSNPICHPSPTKKIKCSFLDYVQLLMIGQAGRWTRTPSATPLQSKKWNAHFWITFNFWLLAGLVNGLEPHSPPLSSQKNEMLIFGLHSTSDDRLGWSMDSNPIGHPSPAKKIKCSFLGYIKVLMIGQAGQWTQTPSTTPLKPKKWNAHLWITFNFWWSAGLVNGLEPHLPPLSSQKNEMLIFGLCSTSDDQPGWSMDLNPICHPSPAKIIKCSVLDYVQLLVIGWAIWAVKVNRNVTKGPLSHQTMKCSFLGYIQLLMIGQAIQVMKVDQNVKKWNVVSVRVFCCFSLGLLLFQSWSSVHPPLRWKDRK